MSDLEQCLVKIEKRVERVQNTKAQRQHIHEKQTIDLVERTLKQSVEHADGAQPGFDREAYAIGKEAVRRRLHRGAAPKHFHVDRKPLDDTYKVAEHLPVMIADLTRIMSAPRSSSSSPSAS